MLDQTRGSDESNLKEPIGDAESSMRTLRRLNPARLLSRRRVLKVLTGLGVGSAVFRRALAAQAEESKTITAEMIQQSEWIAGIELKPDDRTSTARALTRAIKNFEQLRAVKLENGVAPALVFNPAPGQPPASNSRGQLRLVETPAPQRPSTDDDLAFLPLTALAALLRTRQVTSGELTKLYLSRLRRYDDALKCVVTLTEELALRQAERADREIAAGHYRGPLHGIPWGAKDLISWPGYKTTWGATPFKDQVIDTKATVAARLEEAGAVLVAKLALGALAQGDEWFGNMTRNPWDIREGSSGSSAGSAVRRSRRVSWVCVGKRNAGEYRSALWPLRGDWSAAHVWTR